MGMNDTPSGKRVHIGFFGRRNAGKSSVVNAVTGQNLSIVSDTKGRPTLLQGHGNSSCPGPVVIIDTPGIDDVGALGKNGCAGRSRSSIRPTLPSSSSTGQKIGDADEDVVALICSE